MVQIRLLAFLGCLWTACGCALKGAPLIPSIQADDSVVKEVAVLRAENSNLRSQLAIYKLRQAGLTVNITEEVQGARHATVSFGSLYGFRHPGQAPLLSIREAFV